MPAPFGALEGLQKDAAGRPPGKERDGFGLVCLYGALRGRHALHRHGAGRDAPHALHNEGKGAKYTRGRRPVCEIYPGSAAPTALRHCGGRPAVKRLSRQQKLQLAASSGQGRGGA